MKRISHRRGHARPELLGNIGVRIWSDEHRAWWRPGGAGYTVHLEASGFYSPHEAIAHTRGLDRSKRIIFDVAEDLPIIYSEPMVRAILEGRKWMTRRLASRTVELAPGGLKAKRPTSWQKARPGDRLWVRETHAIYQTVNHVRRSHGGAFSEISDGLCAYRADDHATIEDLREHIELMGRGTGQEAVEIKGNKWLPSIHMPRWASRLTLTVTGMKIEPLQDISREDAVAEGISWSVDCEGWSWDPADGGPGYHATDPRRSFETLFCMLHGDEVWNANPDVVALTFTVEQRNIDALKEAA